jgi:hypothetical protein
MPHVEIAQTKLAIVRELGNSKKFVPALQSLRFTPELASGLRRKYPDSGSKAGVLMGALLSQEHALAQLPAAQRLREAAQARLQAASQEQLQERLTGVTQADRRFLAQRVAALQLQSLSTGLSTRELADLGRAEH